MNIKQKIVDCIKDATENLGYKLVEGKWGNNDNKCACALGCVLATSNVNSGFISDDPEDNKEYAAKILNVSSEWVECFISGFDGDSESNIEISHRDAYDMGIQVREEFSGKVNV